MPLYISLKNKLLHLLLFKPTIITYMRSLKFICVQPDDFYYVWQTHLWLESLKKIGHSKDAIVLVFTPKDRNPDLSKWQKIAELYPEAEFKYYKDQHDITSMLGVYVSVLRPYTLWRYFKENPQKVGDAIFYCDCDIVFTEDFNVDHLLEDNNNYVSDTNSYINASYFDSKIRDVLPEKLEEYKTRDVLAEVTSLIGVNRQIAEENNLHSGGAQYLLKNIDAKFWSKVMNDCIIIRTYLQNINKQFFESENKGFQSWCADMWAVLWNLWLRETTTLVVPEMGFSWATDTIDRLKTHPIYHNAGLSSELLYGHPCFYKGKYHAGLDPFSDGQIDIVLKNEESKKYCHWYYVKELKELYDKYYK